tara:strand:+ start:3611 stop:4270 length:660 start_codon:yes stop_codon:yes gene_type:complete
MVEISKNSKQEKDQDKNTEEEISQESGKEQDLNTETQDLKDSDIENENIDQSVKNDDLNKKLEDFESEIISLKEEKLRLLAEMENLRKRSDKEKVDSIRYGSINFVREVLSPFDNLSRALDSIPEELEKDQTIQNLIDGIKMVKKEFFTILEKNGVKKIEALETKFDHNFHQAMLEVETEEHEEGMVVQEIQTGFTMHDKLLRPSMVGVSKKPKNEEKK